MKGSFRCPTCVAIVFAAVGIAGIWSKPQAAAADKADLEVWTLTGLDRALRDAPPGPNKKAVVHAARNEWESFQIALRAATPIRIQDVVAGPLRGPSGSTLPADSITLYREHQLHIVKPSPRNKEFKEGWYPDALIPFRNPMTGERLEGGRFRAAPFELPANETHAFWVDLHIPSDAKAGSYKGEFAVKLEGAPPIAVPVEVVVWDFALPERPTMYTEFGAPGERIGRYYSSLVKKGALSKAPELGPVEEQCAQLTSDNRFNSFPPSRLLADRRREDGSFELTPEQLTGLREWATKYHLNAIPLPRPQGRFKDPAADREKIHRWLKGWDRALDAAGVGDLLAYIYILDEPNTAEAYDEVRRWGKVVREAGSRVKVLVTEQTKTQNPAWGDLYGAVDIWVPLFPLFDPETGAARQKLGEQIWTYTALCQDKQPTPWWETDFPIVNYRAPAWIGWRYGMKGLLYWGGMAYWDGCDDVWTDPSNYKHGEGKEIFNGEGMLVYPARDVGFDGIVPSMRLKAIRDSLEDFDYLALLESQGLRDQALEVVMPVGGSWFQWAQDPDAYLKAREKLATLILEGKSKK